MNRREFCASLAVGGAALAMPGGGLVAEEPPTIKFTAGGEADLQVLLDKAPEGAVVVCEQARPLVVSKSLTIGKRMTLRGLKADLPEKLGNTPILIVDAKGVALADLEMHGNYDSVAQAVRAPFVHIKRGEFLVERCKFYDGSKDGLMVTPDDGAGDIVGGAIRNIEGFRMGRDLVSLSGGCGGQRIRNVTVENVSLKRGYYRGAVEVSDGTDNITVRHVYAEDAVYAIDVQDHGAVLKGKPKPSAPNTHVTLEDVKAVRCKHVIRTVNHPLGHADLTLRDFSARNCKSPVQLSNTTRVRVENLAVIDEPPADKPRITLSHCDDVVLRNVSVKGLKEGVEAVQAKASTGVKIKGLTRDDKGGGPPPAIAEPGKP